MTSAAQGISPIQGISGFVISDGQQATPEQRLGGTADPRHSDLGEIDTPYPWEAFPGEPHGPYGAENGLLGMDICSYSSPAGQVRDDPTMDQTPITHAAPWPKGVPQSTFPDETTPWRDQENDIHASNLGGSREALYLPTANPVQDDWQEIWDVDPGETFPAMQELPSQLLAGGSGGWGSRDRVQSYAGQNGFGFDSWHRHRRYAAGSIPGNYMWLQPGGRPLVKTVPGTAKVPVGTDSPFYGQDPGVPYDPQGAALMTLPAAYQAPPDPALAVSNNYTEPPPVPLW